MSGSKSSLAKSSTPRSLPAAETAAPDTAAPAANATLTTDLSEMEAMPSPALDLQENLRSALTGTAPRTEAAPGERKIPIGWALTAVLVGCGAIWACIALVVL